MSQPLLFLASPSFSHSPGDTGQLNSSAQFSADWIESFASNIEAPIFLMRLREMIWASRLQVQVAESALLEIKCRPYDRQVENAPALRPDCDHVRLQHLLLSRCADFFHGPLEVLRAIF